LASIIDSLMVEIGLDPAKFTKGQRDVEASFKKTKESAEQAAKDIEASGKKSSAFFAQLRLEAIEFFAVIEAAKGLKDFVIGLTDSNAALGKTAKTLDVSTENLSKWQTVAKLSGGTAEGITGTLQSLNQAYQQFQTNPGSMTGNPILGYLTAIGMSISDLKDADTILLKLADHVRGMDPALAKNWLKNLGIGDEGTINLILKGRTEIERYLDEARKIGPITEANSRAAQAWQESSAKLSLELERLGTTLGNYLIPILEKFNDVLENFLAHINESLKLLSDDLKKIFKAIEAGWRELWDNNASTFARDFIARIRNTGPDLLAALKQVFNAVFEWLKEGFNTIWEKAFGFRPFSDAGAATAGAGTGGAGAGAGGGGGIGLGARAAAGGGGGAGADTGGAGASADTVSGEGSPDDYKGSYIHSGEKRRGLGVRYGQAMRIAEDQLRKEGIPEGNIRAAAAIMVGNASTESELIPSTVHDHGTGYGIYGARDPRGGRPNELRRTRMLEWLARNGYAKDSLVGQMRYMAIEAHQRGGPAWHALMNANEKNIRESGEVFEGKFEAPGRINNRNAQILSAYRAHSAALSHGAAAAHRALLMHRGQRHLLQDSHATHDHSQHTSSVSVGHVNVHTQTDARGIARDMREAMDRELQNEHANSGLA
jgi:Phage tail lysozyme